MDLVIDVLQLPFQKGIDIDLIHLEKYEQLRSLMNLLYRLLKQMSKENLTNARIIACHVAVFRSHLGKGMLVTPTIKEIYTGKRELLNEIKPDLVAHFVDLIRKEKLPQYIDFLMSICVSGPDSHPEPIAKVQNMVMHAIFEENSFADKSSVLPRMRVSKKQNGGVNVCAMIEGERWMDLSDFRRLDFVNPKTKKQEDYAGWIMTAALYELNAEQKMFRYMIRCTNLYGRLALGRNQNALRLLICNPDLGLEYDSILSIMQEETLPYLFRARHVTLMSRLFVERDPQTIVPFIVNTRVWSEVTPEKSQLDLSGDQETKDSNSGQNSIPRCETGFHDLVRFLLVSNSKLANLKDGSGNPSLNGKVSYGQLELIRTQLELSETMLSYGFLRGKSQRPLDTSKATVTASVDFAPPGGNENLSRRGSLASGGAFSANQLRDLITGLFLILDSRGADRTTRAADTSTEAMMRNAVMHAAALPNCVLSSLFALDLPSRLVPSLALPHIPVYFC